MAAALLVLPHNASLQESMSLYSVSRLWQNKAVNEFMWKQRRECCFKDRISCVGLNDKVWLAYYTSITGHYSDWWTVFATTDDTVGQIFIFEMTFRAVMLVDIKFSGKF